MFTFVMALAILVILALAVNLFNVDVEINFDVGAVTRFQGCDVALLSVLRSEVTDNDGNGLGYDFSEAIALEKSGDDLDFDIEGEADDILKEVFPGGAEFKITGSGINCVGSLDRGCSQVVPDKKGGLVEVCIVETPEE